MAKKSIRTVGVKLNMDAEVIPVTSQLVSRIVKASMVLHKMIDGGIEEGHTETDEDGQTVDIPRRYGYVCLEDAMLQEVDEQVMSILDDLVSAFEEE